MLSPQRDARKRATEPLHHEAHTQSVLPDLPTCHSAGAERCLLLERRGEPVRTVTRPRRRSSSGPPRGALSPHLRADGPVRSPSRAHGPLPSPGHPDRLPALRGPARRPAAARPPPAFLDIAERRAHTFSRLV